MKIFKEFLKIYFIFYYYFIELGSDYVALASLDFVL